MNNITMNARMREEERLWSRNFCMDFDVIAYSRRTYMTQKLKAITY